MKQITILGGIAIFLLGVLIWLIFLPSYKTYSKQVAELVVQHGRAEAGTEIAPGTFTTTYVWNEGTYTIRYTTRINVLEISTDEFYIKDIGLDDFGDDFKGDIPLKTGPADLLVSMQQNMYYEKLLREILKKYDLNKFKKTMDSTLYASMPELFVKHAYIRKNTLYLGEEDMRAFHSLTMQMLHMNYQVAVTRYKTDIK